MDHNITAPLRAWIDGDEDAIDQLFPLILGELRRLADYFLRDENPAHAPEPSELLSEVTVRLLGSKPGKWTNRVEFFAFTRTCMRNVIVDRARRRIARRRGGAQLVLESLTTSQHPPAQQLLAPETVIDIHRALAELSASLQDVVEARIFLGLTEEETVKALGISLSTVKRRWIVASKALSLRLASYAPGGKP